MGEIAGTSLAQPRRVRQSHPISIASLLISFEPGGTGITGLIRRGASRATVDAHLSVDRMAGEYQAWRAAPRD